MAQYWVTFKCGHEDRVSLSGPYKKRDYIMEQMKDELCPTCLAKQREEVAHKILLEDLRDGLPELKGTEKQVIWALQLRRNLRDMLTKLKDEYEMKSEEHTDEEDYMKAGRRFEKRIDYGFECLKTLTKAEDYINNREKVKGANVYRLNKKDEVRRTGMDIYLLCLAHGMPDREQEERMKRKAEREKAKNA